MRWLLRALGFLTVGCGGASGAIATLSGAVTATESVVVTAGLNSHLIETTPMWAFAMGPASVEGYPPFSVNIFLPGNAPMAGIFTTSNTLDAETSLDAGQWTQSFASTGGTAVGTFELLVTATGAPSPPDGTGWPYDWRDLHGTLKATLVPTPAINTQTGDVTLDVRF